MAVTKYLARSNLKKKGSQLDRIYVTLAGKEAGKEAGKSHCINPQEAEREMIARMKLLLIQFRTSASKMVSTVCLFCFVLFKV